MSNGEELRLCFGKQRPPKGRWLRTRNAELVLFGEQPNDTLERHATGRKVHSA